MLTQKINSYLAVLIITIAGSGAALIITHVAYRNAFDTYTVRAQFSRAHVDPAQLPAQ